MFHIAQDIISVDSFEVLRWDWSHLQMTISMVVCGKSGTKLCMGEDSEGGIIERDYSHLHDTLYIGEHVRCSDLCASKHNLAFSARS